MKIKLLKENIENLEGMMDGLKKCIEGMKRDILDVEGDILTLEQLKNSYIDLLKEKSKEIL